MSGHLVPDERDGSHRPQSPLQRRLVHRMPTALDPGDLGIARAHPPGELALTDAELGAAVDDQLRGCGSRGEPDRFLAVGSATLGSPGRCRRGGLSDRTEISRPRSHLFRFYKLAATPPAASWRITPGRAPP